jgi:cell division protease FtsH
MFAGVGASRIRDMFAQAKKSAPCIIFIDEIDAIGKTRGGGMGGVNDEREQALNQLLVEMDGIEASQGVIILAATNRPETLDPALKRPGRLDRLVTVPQPDVLGRQHILTVHARTVPLSHDVDLKAVARGTPGFAGADLANLVNEAALLAARRNKRFVGMSEFEDAREKLIMGASNTSRVISDEMRRLIAYHEAGHALLVLHQPHSEPIHKVTIIGRAGAGGYMARLPNEDTPTTRDKLRADLIVTTGGRIAEELALDGISIGAVGDIAQVTDLARAMVTQYGFSDKVGFVRHSGGQQNFLGQSVGRAADISPDTQKLIDEEIKALIDTAYASGREILTRHRDQLDRIAAALLEHETLTGDETALAASQGSAAVTARRNAKQTTLLNPAAYAGAMSEAIDPVPA